jgi:hypothetical protein
LEKEKRWKTFFLLFVYFAWRTKLDLFNSVFFPFDLPSRDEIKQLLHFFIWEKPQICEVEQTRNKSFFLVWDLKI